MDGLTRTFALSDGRELDVYLGGADDGFPLLMDHGTRRTEPRLLTGTTIANLADCA